MLWGGFRTGTNANGKATYCANIGHQQDDESGLIYMRARNYEPGSGRFVSEDPAMDGSNWYSYCRSQPISQVDYNEEMSLGEEGIANGEGQELESQSGSCAMNFKKITTNKLKSLFKNCKKADGSTIEDWEARELIHALKKIKAWEQLMIYCLSLLRKCWEFRRVRA
jgi:RHS repeat-associated protein